MKRRTCQGSNDQNDRKPNWVTRRGKKIGTAYNSQRKAVSSKLEVGRTTDFIAYKEGGLEMTGDGKTNFSA